MRVLLGLALLAGVNAQSTFVTVLQNAGGAISQYGNLGQTSQQGSGPWVSIRVRQSTFSGAVIPVANLQTFPTVSNPGNYRFTVANTISSLVFELVTNQFTGQAAYRWLPNYLPTLNLPAGAAALNFDQATYLCDPCTLAANVWVGDATKCAQAGPGANLPTGGASTANYRCGSLTRFYQMDNLVTANNGNNNFGFCSWDVSTTSNTIKAEYYFVITRLEPQKIVGDPQIVGMQGQDFQVHGIPDEVFNMVSYPTLQINARFSYLESADCLDNYTACFAHPGTYISEEGFRLGKDKVRVTAGSHKKGLTVSVNGKKVNRNTDLKLGSIEIVNHRRVIVHSNIMKVTVTNSDKFLNQELELNDDKLISLGAKRRHLKDNEKFHSEVPLHGLQGQTWRNVEYASGLDYEGSITDYHVVDGNLFGTDFVFNQFEA